MAAVMDIPFSAPRANLQSKALDEKPHRHIKAGWAKYNMNNNLVIKILESWRQTYNPFNSTEELRVWIDQLNRDVFVKVRKISLEKTETWDYSAENKGIVKENGSFFQIKGLVKNSNGKKTGQPIIVQNEIGYLGIICKEIDHVLYFLMQAKIEPGNINKIQISPTIQATKSNFMQAHGGRTPNYLEFFTNSLEHDIIVDQIQSEQSSRFLKKRNRNIIIKIDTDIAVLPNYKWMTLGQIKQLMRIDNLVNMDTRTVISCIPFSLRNYTKEELSYMRGLFSDGAFFSSVFYGKGGNDLNKVYQYINNVKMMDMSTVEVVDLFSLDTWNMVDNEFMSPRGEFKIVFCDIEIEGREIQQWQQPLLEATCQSTFALMYCVNEGRMLFLVQTISEVGCFDKLEIGPSVQRPTDKIEMDRVSALFSERYRSHQGIVFDGLFSEEGGRFYHEQNRNVIMKIEMNDMPELPMGYFWLDFETLNILIQINNCLNIQLRNLLSLLEL